jgi:hypothetical protein
MKLLEVKKSTRPGKKWMAIFTKCGSEDKRTVHFGASGYEDYTIHKDTDRRRLYRLRHAKEKNQAPDTPGSLSYHLLWGDSTSLQENIKAFRKKLSC